MSLDFSHPLNVVHEVAEKLRYQHYYHPLSLGIAIYELFQNGVELDYCVELLLNLCGSRLAKHVLFYLGLHLQFSLLGQFVFFLLDRPEQQVSVMSVLVVVFGNYFVANQVLQIGWFLFLPKRVQALVFELCVEELGE